MGSRVGTLKCSIKSPSPKQLTGKNYGSHYSWKKDVVVLLWSLDAPFECYFKTQVFENLVIIETLVAQKSKDLIR